VRFEIGTDGNVSSRRRIGNSTSAQEFFLSEPKIRNTDLAREDSSINVEDIDGTV